MKRAMASMGAVLLVIAVGLLIYAGTADRERNVAEIGNTLAGATFEDPGSGGTPYRWAAGISGGVGLVLLVGAATYDE